MSFSKSNLERADAHVRAGADLVADVNRGGRVFTDHDHRQTGLDAEIRLQASDTLTAFEANFRRDFFSIDDLCRHRMCLSGIGAGEQ